MGGNDMTHVVQHCAVWLRGDPAPSAPANLSLWSPVQGREAEDVTVSELSRLDSVRNMTPQELEEKIKMLRAGCLAYIPVPLVEAAIAYMRAINPGVSDAALMSSSTTPPEGVHYNDGVFMRIVNLDREEECKRVWWLVFKVPLLFYDRACDSTLPCQGRASSGRLCRTAPLP